MGGSWIGFGRVLALLVAFLGRFFLFPRRLGALLGPSWRRLGPSWGPLGPVRVLLGAPNRHIRRMEMRFDTKIKNLALAAVRA